MSGSPKKIAYLEGLRGVAALCVVVGHCVQVSQEMPGAQPLLLLRVFCYFSSLSVPTFIVLSGYVLTLPTLGTGRIEGGALNFLYRRACRILPAYYAWLFIGLAVAVLVTHATSWYAAATPNFISSLFLTTDFFGLRPDFNRPLWSLPIEWHIYFAFPLMVWATVRFGISRTFIGAVSLLFLLMLPLAHFSLGWVQPQFYVLFLLGGLAARIASVDTARMALIRALPWSEISSSAAVIFATFAFGSGWSAYTGQPIYFELAFGGLVFAVLLALSTLEGNRLRDGLQSRPALWVGKRSYSLYLCHWPVLSAMAFLTAVLTRHAPNVLTFLLLVTLTLPISLLLSAASYWLLERPYLRCRHPRTETTDPLVTVVA